MIKLVTSLQYEYAQLTMDRFCESTVFIPSLVKVYFATLPFFLCLER